MRCATDCQKVAQRVQMRYPAVADDPRMKPLSIRLPERHIAWLDRQAGDLDTRSALIRRLIDQAMKAATSTSK